MMKTATPINILLLVALVTSIGCVTVFGHDALEKQIAEVSKEIKSKPRDASLLIRRAELYRLHKEWKNSETDLLRAGKIEPGHSELRFAFGRLFFDLGRYSESKSNLVTFVKKNPTSYGATLLLANVFRRLNKPEQAIKMYSAVISISRSDSSEIYLLRAQTEAETGDLKSALNGIDEGIQKLGGLVVLHKFAIDLELRLKKFSDAQDRNDKLMQTMSRKEPYLLRKGEILLLAGKPCEARTALSKAGSSYKAYSESRKNIDGIKKELAVLNNLLNQTASCD